MLNSQNWLSRNFFLFFFTWGIFLPYFTGWLTNERGLSITDASIIMASGMVARAISTFVTFPIATSKFSLRNIMIVSAILSFVLMSLFSIGNSFFTLLSISILFNFIYSNLLPATESSASLLMQKERIHYGKSRSYGSLGYTTALLLIGVLVGYFGDNAILWMMLFGLFIFTMIQLLPSPDILKVKTVRPATKTNISPFRELMQSKVFVVALILVILLQGAHASYYNYGYIYLRDLHVSGIWIGVILNVAVIFEIIFFTQADKWLRNTKPSTMFLLAAIGSTVRWLLIFTIPTVSAFVISQVLHTISFGLAHFGFIQFITKKLRQDLIPTAQGMYVAFAMSLSTAILTFVGGFLYDIKPGFAFLGMIAFTIPAIFIVLLSRKKLQY